MPGLDDADLARRFAAGDEAAVRDLWARFAGPVLTIAVRALGRRDLADEVLQTTMLNAWRSAATYDPARGALAPWVYAIARRVAIDVHRREARAAVPADVDDDALVADGPSFERTWEAWAVRTALAALPPDEADVVRLAHLEGLTHREVAARLGVPVGTVKSRSARAHKRLAASLGHLVAVGR